MSKVELTVCGYKFYNRLQAEKYAIKKSEQSGHPVTVKETNGQGLKINYWPSLYPKVENSKLYPER